MFRHQGHVLREFIKKQRIVGPTRTSGASLPQFHLLKIKCLKYYKFYIAQVSLLCA